MAAGAESGRSWAPIRCRLAAGSPPAACTTQPGCCSAPGPVLPACAAAPLPTATKAAPAPAGPGRGVAPPEADPGRELGGLCSSRCSLASSCCRRASWALHSPGTDQRRHNQWARRERRRLRWHASIPGTGTPARPSQHLRLPYPPGIQEAYHHAAAAVDQPAPQVCHAHHLGAGLEEQRVLHLPVLLQHLPAGGQAARRRQWDELGTGAGLRPVGCCSYLLLVPARRWGKLHATVQYQASAAQPATCPHQARTSGMAVSSFNSRLCTAGQCGSSPRRTLGSRRWAARAGQAKQRHGRGARQQLAPFGGQAVHGYVHAERAHTPYPAAAPTCAELVLRPRQLCQLGGVALPSIQVFAAGRGGAGQRKALAGQPGLALVGSRCSQRR